MYLGLSVEVEVGEGAGGGGDMTRIQLKSPRVQERQEAAVRAEK